MVIQIKDDFIREILSQALHHSNLKCMKGPVIGSKIGDYCIIDMVNKTYTVTNSGVNQTASLPTIVGKLHQHYLEIHKPRWTIHSMHGDHTVYWEGPNLVNEEGCLCLGQDDVRDILEHQSQMVYGEVKNKHERTAVYHMAKSAGYTISKVFSQNSVPFYFSVDSSNKRIIFDKCSGKYLQVMTILSLLFSYEPKTWQIGSEEFHWEGDWFTSTKYKVPRQTIKEILESGPC